MHEALITHQGLAKLREELELLTKSGRQEIADRIRRAFSAEANTAENAEYHDVREEQMLLERRIASLEEQIVFAQPVEPDAFNGKVDVGERVRLQDLDSGETVEYEVVGSFEADPFSGRISAASPLGAALLGRRSGDVAIVEAPKGRLRFEILAIDSTQNACRVPADGGSSPLASRLIQGTLDAS